MSDLGSMNALLRPHITFTPVCTTPHTPLRPPNYQLYRNEVDVDFRAKERAGTFNGES